jgi:GNAT superfamily N-acetyltransferase
MPLTMQDSTVLQASSEAGEIKRGSRVERYDESRHKVAVANLGNELYRLAGYRAFDAEKFLAYLLRPEVYAALYREGGIYTAGLVGLFMPPSFGDAGSIVKDLGFYVIPERRGSLAAVYLVRDMEQWAREKGARYVMLAQSNGHEIERTRRFYEHLGYGVIGYLTRKEL